MKTKTTLNASLLIATLFIAACGNKGDLFLTEDPAAQPAPSVEQTQEKAVEEKKK